MTHVLETQRIMEEEGYREFYEIDKSCDDSICCLTDDCYFLSCKDRLIYTEKKYTEEETTQ